MLNWLLVPVYAFLDRWGGGGFAFLGASENHPLGKGAKWARRYGIPLLVWLNNRTLDQAILCVALGAILSFNLKEIAERDWEEVFLHGFGIAAVLWPTAGRWALLVPAWWVLGVFWSNIGILGRKIGWHWVELIRGAMIGLALAL